MCEKTRRVGQSIFVRTCQYFGIWSTLQHPTNPSRFFGSRVHVSRKHSYIGSDLTKVKRWCERVFGWRKGNGLHWFCFFPTKSLVFNLTVLQTLREAKSWWLWKAPPYRLLIWHKSFKTLKPPPQQSSRVKSNLYGFDPSAGIATWLDWISLSSSDGLVLGGGHMHKWVGPHRPEVALRMWNNLICVFFECGDRDGGQLVFVMVDEKANLHPGHPKEWDEGERNEIEQSWLCRLEHLQN